MSNLKRSLSSLADKSERIILNINRKRFKQAEKLLDEDEEKKLERKENEPLFKYVSRCCKRMNHSKPVDKYSYWLGANNIIDLSQNEQFESSTRSELEKYKLVYTFKNEKSSKLRKKLESLKLCNKKELNKSRKSVMMMDTKNYRERRIKKLYQLIIEMHCFNSEKFNKQIVALYSEADFIQKFWSYIIESHFEETDFVPHWGDTISDACKNNNIKLKLDFRLRVIPLSSNDYDTSTGEFARQARPTKLFGDKLKSIIATKAMLNSIATKYKLNTEEIMKLKFPIIQVMGLEATISVFSLVAPKLYILQDIYAMNFPASCKDLRNDGIKKIYHGLLMIEQLSDDIKAIIDSKDTFIVQNKMNSILEGKKKNDKNKAPKNKALITGIKWPTLKDFSNDDDNDEE